LVEVSYLYLRKVFSDRMDLLVPVTLCKEDLWYPDQLGHAGLKGTQTQSIKKL